MTQEIIEDWFYTEFVPKVRSYLKSISQKEKAILFMDNCAAHPLDLESDCKMIICKFLPPNTTGILQPADQGVIASIKQNYKFTALKTSLDRRTKDTQPGKLFADFNIKDVIDILSESWKKCQSNVLAKSWNYLGLNLSIRCTLPKIDTAYIVKNFVEFGLSLDDVNDWLYSTENVPGSNIFI